MPHLQNEKARFQADAQAAAAEIASLTTQRQGQQQAISAAQARVSAAQTRLSAAQAQIPPLEGAVAAAEQQVASANEQVEAHAANEPDPLIEVPNKPPRPNPAWRTWNTRMGLLARQLEQAQADLTAAQTRLDDGRAQVSQATTEKQTAERDVADTTRALAATDAAIAAAKQRQDAAQAQVATVDRWNDAIARDPLVRPTLEQVAAELSARTAALEDEHDVARVQLEIAEETLASLVARRDRLTPALSQVNGQLPAASEELRVAREALTAATRNIQRHRQRGPRP
jgi:chromosome segregation ATPase